MAPGFIFPAGFEQATRLSHDRFMHWLPLIMEAIFDDPHLNDVEGAFAVDPQWLTELETGVVTLSDLLNQMETRVQAGGIGGE